MEIFSESPRFNRYSLVGSGYKNLRGINWSVRIEMGICDEVRLAPIGWASTAGATLTNSDVSKLLPTCLVRQAHSRPRHRRRKLREPSKSPLRNLRQAPVPWAGYS